MVRTPAFQAGGHGFDPRRPYSLEVRHVATVDDDAAALLDAYAQEVYDRTVERDPCRIETVASEYVEPGGTFLVVYEGDEPVGCGAGRPRPSGWSRGRL